MPHTQFISRKIRKILDKLARAERLSGDDAEQAFDSAIQDVHSLPKEHALAHLDDAIGTSNRRRQAAVYLLAELADLPGAFDQLIRRIETVDWRQRLSIIQSLNNCHSPQLGSILNKIMLCDANDLCRQAAAGVAGRLGLSESFQIILKMADRPQDENAAMISLIRFVRPEAEHLFRRVFDRHVELHPPITRQEDISEESIRLTSNWCARKASKVFAAWGLGKLGDREAIGYLGEMLFDHNLDFPGYNGGGAGLRAAQAMADIFGLPFDWAADKLEPIKSWWLEHRCRIMNSSV